MEPDDGIWEHQIRWAVDLAECALKEGVDPVNLAVTLKAWESMPDLTPAEFRAAVDAASARLARQLQRTRMAIRPLGMDGAAVGV